MPKQERNRRYYENAHAALYELLLEFIDDAEDAGEGRDWQVEERPIYELIDWLSRRSRGLTPYYQRRPSPEERAALRAKFGPKPAS
jgi:hypothetical protein